MDVLKKLKSVFIVDDGTPSKTPEPVSEKVEEAIPQTTNEVEVKIATPTFDPQSIEGKAPDAKFMNILLEAIDKANLPGFDYLEYKEALKSLEKMNMDGPTKYQSAMAMAKTMGATPNGVIQAANKYLEVLKAENDKFSQAVQGQKQKVAQDQKEGLAFLQNSIDAKKKQIEQLQAQITDEEKKLDQMKLEISNSASKIAETSAKFNQAFVSVSQEIVDDIKNISQYAAN